MAPVGNTKPELQWQHRLEKIETSRVGHEGRLQQQDAGKAGEFACLVNIDTTWK